MECPLLEDESMLEKEPNIVITCNIMAHIEGFCWCSENFLVPPPISRDLPRNSKGRIKSQEVLYARSCVCSQIYSPGIKPNLQHGDNWGGGGLVFLLRVQESLETRHLGKKASSTLGNPGLKTINSL